MLAVRFLVTGFGFAVAMKAFTAAAALLDSDSDAAVLVGVLILSLLLGATATLLALCLPLLKEVARRMKTWAQPTRCLTVVSLLCALVGLNGCKVVNPGY